MTQIIASHVLQRRPKSIKKARSFGNEQIKEEFRYGRS